jgi:hypothetical protein
MLKFLRVLLSLCALLIPAPAYAGRAGDMFYDSNMVDYARPWVPSDRVHHADMFGSPQPYIRTDKDIFDNVHPPGDFGIEQHFSAHLHALPDDPLYHWPRSDGHP